MCGSPAEVGLMLPALSALSQRAESLNQLAVQFKVPFTLPDMGDITTTHESVAWLMHHHL